MRGSGAAAHSGRPRQGSGGFRSQSRARPGSLWRHPLLGSRSKAASCTGLGNSTAVIFVLSWIPPFEAACWLRSSAAIEPRSRLASLTVQQTCRGSFSAVSKPNFARKYSLESSRRDLHNAFLCTVVNSQNFVKFSIFQFFFAKFARFC